MRTTALPFLELFEHARDTLIRLERRTGASLPEEELEAVRGRDAPDADVGGLEMQRGAGDRGLSKVERERQGS